MGIPLNNPLPPQGAWVVPGKTLSFEIEKIQTTLHSTIRYNYKITLKKLSYFSQSLLKGFLVNFNDKKSFQPFQLISA